ncbi:MAG: class I SAM-dependent methyltransferase [bacterium]
MTSKLPLANPEQAAHSEKLLQLLAKKQQPIRFDDYMQSVLYEPDLGYYAGTLQKFGSEGDFITAPTIGDLFAKTLAFEFSKVFKQLGEHCSFVEIGAGNGQFCVDLLHQLDQLNSLPEHYFIIEISADLKQRQQTLLREFPRYFERMTWLKQLPKNSIKGIIFANEVLDALPVRLFKQECGEISERFVHITDQRVEWTEQIADTAFSDQVKTRLNEAGIPAEQSYSSELCDAANQWLLNLEQGLESGLIWLVDYGYGRKDFYHPQRDQGTLICHYQHHAHDDPLYYPGLTDLSSFVDFTSIAEYAVKAGLELQGYTTQGSALMSLGINNLINVPDQLSAEFVNLAQQFKTLVLPNEMGEKFKMMALSKNFTPSLKAFAQQELHRL